MGLKAILQYLPLYHLPLDLVLQRGHSQTRYRWAFNEKPCFEALLKRRFINTFHLAFCFVAGAWYYFDIVTHCRFRIHRATCNPCAIILNVPPEQNHKSSMVQAASQPSNITDVALGRIE